MKSNLKAVVFYEIDKIAFQNNFMLTHHSLRYWEWRLIINWDLSSSRFLCLCFGFKKNIVQTVSGTCVDTKPFPATAQDRKSMGFLRFRIGDSSNNSNQ